MIYYNGGWGVVDSAAALLVNKTNIIVNGPSMATGHKQINERKPVDNGLNWDYYNIWQAW